MVFHNRNFRKRLVRDISLFLAVGTASPIQNISIITHIWRSAVFQTVKATCIAITTLFFIVVFTSITGAATRPKVLVVMSYGDTNPWENEIREGIESVLGSKAQIKYLYLNTKYDFTKGADSARKAFSIYQDFRPDGVIAADDDAQSLFVVPYLRNKVSTPVMFCGVNAEASKYGYPARNVSGILERNHIGESIAFLKQLVPAVKTIAFLAPDDTMGKLYKRQIDGEARSYSAKSSHVKLVRTLEEAAEVVGKLKHRSDALFLLSMSSLRDSANNQPSDTHIYTTLSHHFGKPIISASEIEIRHGLLCAVVKSGREQGSTAATMLSKAMSGIPLSLIPVTVNVEGKRMINVSVLKSLGIRPRPMALRGAELVTTESTE